MNKSPLSSLDSKKNYDEIKGAIDMLNETNSSYTSSSQSDLGENMSMYEGKCVKSIKSEEMNKRKRVVLKLPDGTYSHGMKSFIF